MLPDIEGLKMAEGLARLGGDSRMYGRLLVHFAQQCEGTLSLIQTAVQADDRELLRGLAHKLKGVSGGLGAWTVEQAARNLEMTTGQQVQSEFQALSTNLRDICARINHCRTNWLESDQQGTFLELSQERLCEKLQAELQSFDCEALDSWTELSARLAGKFPDFELEEVNALVFGLDFPKALKRLRTLLGEK